MAVVARNAMARFRVDLSARLFRHDGCDAIVHDEKRRHGLHVAVRVDG
jgi:hypothetical protein